MGQRAVYFISGLQTSVGTQRNGPSVTRFLSGQGKGSGEIVFSTAKISAVTEQVSAGGVVGESADGRAASVGAWDFGGFATES